METHGIETIKKAVDFAQNFAEALDKAKKDGKINWMDFPHLIPVAKDVADLSDELPQLMNEFEDMSDTEREELYAYIRVRYVDSRPEKIVQESLAFVLSTVSRVDATIDEAKALVKLIKKKKD